MSLAVLFCSCDPVPAEETTTGTEAGTAAENAPIAEPEEVEHEIRDHFVIENGIEHVSLKGNEAYKGEVVDYDRENNLIALVTKDLDNSNYVIETVKVYDVTSGECIFEASETYLLFATGADLVEFNVNIDYPIIRVSTTGYSEDGLGGFEPYYDVSYYFAKKDGEEIKTTNNDNYSRTDFYNGLVAFEMGDEIVWVNKNMEVVRTVNAVAANGYNIDVFNAEYQDYLYAWNNGEVQVFNKAGVCSAKYTIQHDGFIKAHVLNNGNVLIQDFEVVDAYTACDFVWTYNEYESNYAAERINLTSYVMSCTDGALKEVELDFIVEEVETAYEGRLGNNSFPFALAGNGQNQAYIYRIANGSISLWQEYVSLGNDLEIKYSVKSTMIGADFSTAEVVNANIYRMSVKENGVYNPYFFDLDGNVITAATSFYSVTDTYVVTNNGIYDHKMNSVFSFADNGFLSAAYLSDPTTNTIYLAKHNFETGADEFFVFDHATKAPKLLCDGVSKSLINFGEGFYVVYDSENNDQSIIDATSGKVILKALDITNIVSLENAYVVETEFEGNTLVYVIK